MEPRRFIRSDILASVIAHMSILALLILSAEVHPFRAVPSETIAIDLVTPAEVEKKPEPAPTPQIPLPDLSKLADSAPPAAAPQQPAAAQSQQRQAARSAAREPAAAQPQPQSPPPTAQAASPPRGYTPPEPDITVKYHVMLGLPETPPLPTASSPPSGDKPGDGADANASTAADIASSLIAEFRRYLKTCSKLPPAIDRSDEIEIKLRVFMTPDGRLAGEPNPVGVKHPSENGPALLQSAIAALRACQPYAMLPKDRYGEWKVIDLTFTPRDFTGG